MDGCTLEEIGDELGYGNKVTPYNRLKKAREVLSDVLK
jgi:hypothetical protein